VTQLVQIQRSIVAFLDALVWLMYKELGVIFLDESCGGLREDLDLVLDLVLDVD
jgi:hypothetical protein